MPVMKLAAAGMLLVIAPLLAAEDPLKGTFCLVAKGVPPKCQPLTGDVATVVRSEKAQPFVWSSSDGKSIVAGVVAPKLESVRLRDEALRPVTLSLRGDRRHGWPADVRVRVAQVMGSEWMFTIPAKSAEILAQIRVPEGKYTLLFGADHHRTEERRFAPGKGGTSLKEVVLHPMPVISGRIVTSKDQPIANAEVIRPDRKVIATSDEQGNFRGEAGEPPPESVFLSKPGFGSRNITLQPSSGDSELGMVRLVRGVEMTLRIVKPESLRDPLTVDLLLVTPFKYQYTPVATKQLPEKQSTIVFDDLGKGTYLVVVSGKGPSEKVTEEIAVDEANFEKEIKIEPYRVEGSVRIGEDPLDGAIEISGSMTGTQHMHAARYSLPIENGRFAANFWQHGTIFGFVNSRDKTVSQPVQSPALGDDPSVWKIQFAKRFLTGRIYDAETRATIPQATLEHLITTDSAKSRSYGSTKIHDDGSFSILATGAGTYELKVAAPGYVADKQTIEVAEQDVSSQHDFALTHGTAATLEVVWPSGEPVVNAACMEGVASDGHNAERHYPLDASGHVTVRMRKGESRTLFIVPMEGSFAVVHLTAPGNDAAPVRIVVPRPAGGLHVRIADKEGKRVRVSVGMRFNGEPIPEPVLMQISFRATINPEEFQLLQLPAGAYELWPVAPSGTALGAAKTLSLTTGEVKVDFVTGDAP